HAHPAGPLAPLAKLPDEGILDHGQSRGAQERPPLRGPVAAHVRWIATPLDFEDKGARVAVVVAEGVLEEERAPWFESRRNRRDGGRHTGEVMRRCPARHDVERLVREGQGGRVASDEPAISRAAGPPQAGRGGERG